MDRTTPSKPSRKAAPPLPARVLEVSAGFLHHRGLFRPASTLAWAVAAGLASLPAEATDQTGILKLTMNQDLWLDTLFNDWRVSPAAWDKREREAALALLQMMVNRSQAILPPLPAYPARPSFSGAVRDKLWAHVDFAGWRLMRFLEDAELEAHVDAAEALLARLQEGVDLLEQFELMMIKAYTDQGASAKDYTEELAQHLMDLHRVLDAAAQKAGLDPLGWPVPDYRGHVGEAIPLPPGPRGPALPEALARDVRQALASRKCGRPLATLGPFFGRYGAIKAALEPGWTWSPARDGRECAFIVFESTMLELPPWTPAQARALSRLCTAAYSWFQDQPLPPQPDLTLDPRDDEGTALWIHQDLLFLAGSTLGIGLGILPEPGDNQAFKRARRLRGQWGEVQSLVWGATFHWPGSSLEQRELLAASLPLALGAVYQGFRNEIAKVDRAFLRFVPKPPESLLPPAKQAMARFGKMRQR